MEDHGFGAVSPASESGSVIHRDGPAPRLDVPPEFSRNFVMTSWNIQCSR